MTRKETPERFYVIVDHPSWPKPRRVSRHASLAAARDECRRLNSESRTPGSPLFFVEDWCTSYVLDTEHSTR